MLSPQRPSQRLFSAHLPVSSINELTIVSGQLLVFAINAGLDAVITNPHVWCKGFAGS